MLLDLKSNNILQKMVIFVVTRKIIIHVLFRKNEKLSFLPLYPNQSRCGQYLTAYVARISIQSPDKRCIECFSQRRMRSNIDCSGWWQSYGSVTLPPSSFVRLQLLVDEKAHKEFGGPERAKNKKN